VFKHFNRGFAANRVLFPFNTVLWFICESCSFSLQHGSVVYLRIVFFFPSTLFCGLFANRVLFPFNTFLWFIYESCSFSLQHFSVVYLRIVFFFPSTRFRGLTRKAQSVLQDKRKVFVFAFRCGAHNISRIFFYRPTTVRRKKCLAAYQLTPKLKLLTIF
jgi:hypothetical protein